MNTLRFKAEQIYRIVKKLQSLKSFRISPVMSCPYLTISHFTVPCDFGWNSENTHHSVNAVHGSEKHDSVKSFRLIAENFAVSTTLENLCPKTDLYGCFSQKEVVWTEKYMSQVYLQYRGTFGTGGTCILESLSFLQKRSLQKLNADKTSGELSAADIDLIGVFKVITALILFEEGTKALL